MTTASPMPSPATRPELWLVRHGETAWTLSGQHTGRTDIPLTEHGRRQAEALKPALAAQAFDRVLCSPLERAQETCRLAGLGARMEMEPHLLEWDYGVYEGRTTADIRREVPDWSVWHSPVPQGEDLAAVQARASALIAQLLGMRGRIALFAHAHILRVLAGCWMADDAGLGAHLVLDTGTLSVLGFERENRAVLRWNLPA